MFVLDLHVRDGCVLTGNVSEHSSGDSGEKEEPISRRGTKIFSLSAYQNTVLKGDGVAVYYGISIRQR